MSQRYGIRYSLEKLSVKYEPPKIEEPTPPEHVCAPCAREKHVVEAGSYCPECKEKLCPKCVHQHQKFQILSTHKVLGIDAAPPSNEPKRQHSDSKLTDPCSEHSNKVLNLYCKKHDEVGCAVCMAKEHKECGDPEYVTKVCQDFKKTGLAKETRDGLISRKKDLTDLKSKRQEDKKRFKQERDDIEEQISAWRKKMNEIIDYLENRARTMLNEKFSTDIKVISKDIKQCEEALALTEGCIKKMFVMDEAKLFVYTKYDGKHCIHQTNEILESVTKRIGTERVAFLLDESIEEWMRNLTVLGRFEHEETAYLGSPFGKYDAVVKSDVEKSDYVFNDSANMPDGRTVITDWKNKRVKLLDNNYAVRSHCDVPGNPYSICDISANEIAVSLRDEKIIQFINIVDKELQLAKRKFKIDEYCRGIAHYNGEIYITCGGGDGEIHGQLRVYNMMGEIMRVFEEDIQGKPIFDAPRTIVVNNQETRIHVCDRKKGVITLSNDGKRVVSVFRDPCLKTPLGLCIDGRGNLYVSGYESNNVVQISADGKKMGEVLRESDGIQSPLSLSCHESTSTRLIITMEGSDTIRVYSLHVA